MRDRYGGDLVSLVRIPRWRFVFVVSVDNAKGFQGYVGRKVDGWLELRFSGALRLIRLRERANVRYQVKGLESIVRKLLL